MARTLLVPLDGSPAGEAALLWAEYFGRARGFSLALLRVVPWPYYVPAGGMDGYISPELYEGMVEAERQAVTAYLEQVRQRLAGGGLDVQVLEREGAAGEEILNAADELGVYAIVMATRGRGGLARLMIGSVAERVVQQATVPVLLVRATEAQPATAPTFRRLLIALDGSSLAERAVDFARALAEPDATLVLARVVPPIERSIVAGDGAATMVDRDAMTRALAQAEAYLNGIAETHRDGNLSVETTVRTGRAASELQTAAEAERADVIVMATHGRTGPARWWLGSVADEVVRHADRPVFLVSARAEAAKVVGDYTVGDVMTRRLSVVRDDEPLTAVLRKLLRGQISGAPVVDGSGKLVGVISEHDLLAWQARLVDELSRDPGLDPSEYARRLETTSAGQVMGRPPLVIEASATLQAAVELFLQQRARRLPVVREGALVGILTRADVLRAMAHRWQVTSGGN